MAEPITMQKLTDASFDADTLGEFANQDRLVTSRLGLKYPSAPMASRLVVENGLLGATPFSTYTAMTGSALLDGDYAVVTNDADDINGVYIKEAGSFELVSYSVQSTAQKAANDKIDYLGFTKNDDDTYAIAFTDVAGRVLLSINNKGGVLLNNTEHYDDPNSVLAYSIVDEQDRVIFGISQNGNLVSSSIDDINERIDGIESNVCVTTVETIKPRLSDHNHLLMYGQSLSVGYLAKPVLSTTQPYNNLTFESGVLGNAESTSNDWSSFKPLVESEDETPTAGLVNDFARRYDTGAVFIGSANGKGGQRINMLNKGTALYGGLINAVQSAYNISQSAEQSYSVLATAWVQGESDYIISSNANQQYYYDALIKLKNDINNDVRAITKQDFKPPFITYQTAAYLSYASRPANNIYRPYVAYAQLQASNNDNDITMACSIYQLKHAVDDTDVHLSNEASLQLGKYTAKALDKVMTDGEFEPLQPKSVVWQGKIIDIEFNKSGLVFDTTIIDEQPNMGFDVWVNDALVDAAIKSVTLIGNRVRIVLNSEPSTNAEICYARGRIGQNRAKGNLRDSDGDNDFYLSSDGLTTYYMHNWCVAFARNKEL